MKGNFTEIIMINDIPIIDSKQTIQNYVKNTMNSKMLKCFRKKFCKKNEFVV
jgi:hypothetical protein